MKKPLAGIINISINNILSIKRAIKTQNKEHSYELLKKINFPFLERRDN